LDIWLPGELAGQREKLAKRIGKWRPRVAVVKQDCNEDLYCCPPGADVWTTISSTLMRSGPVDLFTIFDATFLLVHTEPDLECSIWQEKADVKKWMPRAWFEEFRHRIPGRDHGQAVYSQHAKSINWSAFDIVVSVDVSVPARITRLCPGVVWTYYVREITTPSWHTSLLHPLAGQDLVPSHRFRPVRVARESHVVEFPYHFHHVGVFHELLCREPPQLSDTRSGVFVEYHSAWNASDEELNALSVFGPVYAHREADQRIDKRNGEWILERTMAGDALEALLRSKYYVKWKGRSVFGTAAVEAIAAGCLSLTEESLDRSTFLHTKASLITGFDDLIAKMADMESNPGHYLSELKLQRERVDYLCHYRPANDLLDACERVLAKRQRGHQS
jgi:hypothetical protein